MFIKYLWDEEGGRTFSAQGEATQGHRWEKIWGVHGGLGDEVAKGAGGWNTVTPSWGFRFILKLVRS